MQVLTNVETLLICGAIWIRHTFDKCLEEIRDVTEHERTCHGNADKLNRDSSQLRQDVQRTSISSRCHFRISTSETINVMSFAMTARETFILQILIARDGFQRRHSSKHCRSFVFHAFFVLEKNKDSNVFVILLQCCCCYCDIYVEGVQSIVYVRCIVNGHTRSAAAHPLFYS